MVTVAARAPVAAGVKVRLTAQVSPDLSVVPAQVSPGLAKSPAFVPPSLTLVMTREPAPMLVSVMLLAVLVVPTRWLPKITLAGERLTAGADGGAVTAGV